MSLLRPRHPFGQGESSVRGGEGNDDELGDVSKTRRRTRGRAQMGISTLFCTGDVLLHNSLLLADSALAF